MQNTKVMKMVKKRLNIYIYIPIYICSKLQLGKYGPHICMYSDCSACAQTAAQNIDIYIYIYIYIFMYKLKSG